MTAGDVVLADFLTGQMDLKNCAVGAILLDLAANQFCRQQQTPSKIASNAPAKVPRTIPALQVLIGNFSQR